MKSFKNLTAVVLALSLAFTFASCGKKEETKQPDQAQKTEYEENWVIEPSIVADKIYSLPLCSFNEVTNHYDVSFGDAYVIEKDGKLGFIDSNGEIVVEPKYDTIETCPCTKGYIATVKPENSYRTTYTVDLNFNEMWSYPHNCENYDAYTYIYNSATSTVSVQNGETPLSGGASLPEAVETDSGKFAVALNNKIQGESEYDSAGVFTGGVVAVQKGEKWGYVNSKGETVIAFNYDAIPNHSSTKVGVTPYECSEGYITVLKNGKYGVFSSDGKEVVPCEYSYVTTVHDGRAFVSNDGGIWGVLLIDGDVSKGIKYEEKTTTTTSTAVETTSQPEPDTSLTENQ